MQVKPAGTTMYENHTINKNIGKTEFGCTIEYGKFSYLEYNRLVSEKHVTELMNSISQKHIHLPVVVNEKFEIIDGQHRFKACRELGKPIYYVMQPGLDINDCIRMNTHTKNWTLETYFTMYLRRNFPVYVKLHNLAANYNLAFSQMIHMAYIKRAACKQEIMEGTLKLSTQEEKAFMQCAELYNVVKNDLPDGIGLKPRFLKNFCTIMHHHFLDDIMAEGNHAGIMKMPMRQKRAKFHEQLTKYGAQIINKGFTKDEWVYNQIIECYNYHQHAKSKLPKWHDFVNR